MEKFYNYLLDKKELFLKKEQIKLYFKEFNNLWNTRLSFEKVFDVLRKTKLTYIFDDFWALSREEFPILVQKYLNYLNIENYYGLETALYLNKKIWQPPLIYKLLNTRYNRTRKTNNITIKLIKIPKEIFNEETLITEKLSYSDYTKTILDLIFFNDTKFYEPDKYSKLKLYLSLFSKYPQVKKELLKRLKKINK
jgi:hypothetical protein